MQGTAKCTDSVSMWGRRVPAGIGIRLVDPLEEGNDGTHREAPMRNRDVTQGNRPRQLIAIAIVAAMSLTTASCSETGGQPADSAPSTTKHDGGSSTAASTTTQPPATATTATPTTTAVVSTTAPVSEPPAIHLTGSSTVFSPDGAVRISGWVDRPASVTVAGTSADVLDDPYAGVSTFEASLQLDSGDHAIDITAVDANETQDSVLLTVVVDPALERQIAYVQDVDAASRTVVADYVEFLTGDDAASAARADGAISDDEELPNGFYLRNRNPRLRTLPLGDPAWIVLQACHPDNGPCVVEESVDIDAWIGFLADPESAPARHSWHWYGYGTAPYWLTIQDGVVVHVSEQYLP